MFNGNYQANLKNKGSIKTNHAELEDSLKSNNNYKKFVSRTANKNISTNDQLIKISEKLLKVSLDIEINNKKLQMSVNIYLKNLR